MKHLIVSNNTDQISMSIFGDTVQTDSNQVLFESGDLSTLVGNDIIDILKTSDIAAFNLEAPLSNSQNSIFKPGAPCISSSEESVRFFNSVKDITGCVVLSGANNHIKDFGIEGIKSTERIARDNQLGLVGVSSIDKSLAQEPIVISNSYVSIGLFSCAENEFSIASEKEGGANGYDPLETFDQIEKLNKQVDYVVVLFHAGRENYRYPSINLQKICRKMADKGADLVICQHSHCVGCQEKHKECQIIYGQGNFIFDRMDIEGWKTGLIVKCVFSKNSKKIELLPVRKNNQTVRLATKEDEAKILQGFNERGETVKDSVLLSELWNRFCLENLNIYGLEGIYGCRNRLIRWLDRKTHYAISKRLLSDKYHNQLLLNFIRCESIRESLITVLNSSNLNVNKL